MSMTSVSALGKEWRNSAFIEVINIVKQTIWVSLTKSKVPFFSEPTIGAQQQHAFYDATIFGQISRVI